MTKHRFVATCVALAAVAGPARAGIVVVSSTGKSSSSSPPPPRLHVIDEVLGQLVADGLVVDPTAISQAVGATFPRPQRADPALTATVLFDQMKRGVNAYFATNYVEAEKQLAAAIELAHANVSLIVADFTNRKLWVRAHIDLAVTRQRVGNPQAAEEPMAELARSYPAMTSVADDYGPEADAVFQRARKRLVALGSGSLVVRVNDPTVLVFVDEADQPRNATFEENLLAGTYRILVEDPKGNGRRYDVVVTPGHQTQLAVDWPRDLAISVEPQRVALAFASDAARANEGAYLQGLARPLNTSVAIAVGEIVWQGNPAIVGTTYRVETGEVIWTGLVILDGRDDDDAHALSNFVAWGIEPHDPTLVLVKLTAPPWSAGVPAAPQAHESDEAGWTDYTTGVLAVAALGGGTVLAIDGTHRGLGYGALAAGAVLGVVELVRIVRRHHAETAAPRLPDGAGSLAAVLGWTF